MFKFLFSLVYRLRKFKLLITTMYYYDISYITAIF